MSAWALPGFEVEELLGFGATGEVWRARETATGEVVALKRLRAGADAAALVALHREAALLSSLDTPYVVRLRAVIDGVLVLDHAAGGSLAALLVRRGNLEPGEVVTVAAPLASALAAAHAAGVVHGDVSPANVLFTAEGMPLLSDLGVSRLAGDRLDVTKGTAEYVDPAVAAGGAPDPASDVWALAAVCHHMLAGSPPHEGQSVGAVLAAAVTGSRAPLGLLAPQAPRALVAVVEAALSTDPARRPAAAALATALQRAHAAAPVRLTGAPPAAAPAPDVRETHVVPRPAARPADPVARPRRRPSLSAIGAAAVVLVVLAVGLRWARSGADLSASAQALPPASAPSATTTAAPTPVLSAGPSPGPMTPLAAGPSSGPTAVPATPLEWAKVLAGLDGLREQAFARGDPALLTKVYVPGSAAATADSAVLAALTRVGRTATGVRHEVRRVEQTSYGDDRAQLRVVDVLAPQVVRDAQGSAVESRPGRGEAAYDVALVRQDDGWRIATLTPG